MTRRWWRPRRQWARTGEVKVPARLIGRRYRCHDCGLEMSVKPGVVHPIDPPAFIHSCANGHEETLSQTYPGYYVHLFET